MLKTLLASIRHPQELSALINYKFFPPNANLKRNELRIANDPSKKKCYDFLFLTSRSFAAVIVELDDELRDAICIFYLVLRGLDTIEDDMTLELARKVEILRSFHKIIYQRGWNFNENGPNEKDRILLVEYQCVIDEFLNLKPSFQSIIADITRKMGDGMADYASGEHRINTAIEKVADFDLYCYYVAGLVGHGLSDLFAASGFEDETISEKKELSNAMGKFLQKTNIIRDYLEDLVDGRQFWPKEIWGQYVENFADLAKPGFEDKARACISAMVLNVLTHVPDCLVYLSQLHNQSVFNFCAIPQVMAISTLALVFNNLDIYHRVVKIRKGEAIHLILKSTNMANVVSIFKYYIQEINLKNDPLDPNFMKISIALGKIEQWIQTNMPQHTVVAKPYSANPSILPLFVFTLFVGILGMAMYSRLQ